jgi:hypothetical protein
MRTMASNQTRPIDPRGTRIRPTSPECAVTMQGRADKQAALVRLPFVGNEIGLSLRRPDLCLKFCRRQGLR